MSLLFAALNQAAQEHRAAVAAQQPAVRPVARVAVAPARSSWLGLATVLFIGMMGGVVIVGIMLAQQAAAPPRDYTDTRYLSRDNLMAAPVPIVVETESATAAPATALETASNEPAPDISNGIAINGSPDGNGEVADARPVTVSQVQAQLPQPVVNAIASQIKPYVQPSENQTARQAKAEISVHAGAPEVAFARAESAVAQQLQDDPVKALAAYEVVLARRPNDKAALVGKATALQRMGAGAVALAQWRHLYNKYPKDNAIATAYGQALTPLNAPAARAVLTDVLLRNPDYAPALSALAVVDTVAGDLGAAQSNQEQAWALDKNNPAHRLNLAIIADKRGDGRQALALYQQALEAYSRTGWKATLPMSMSAVKARIDYLANGAE